MAAVAMTADPEITTLFILRVIGVLVVPFGGLMGLFV